MMPESNLEGRSLSEPRNEDYEGARSVRITKEDVLKFGLAQGCPGCIAANRGGTAINHNEECRARIEKALRDAGSKKMKDVDRRMDEALAKQLEKEDTRRNNEKQDEEDKVIEETMEDVFGELFDEPTKGSEEIREQDDKVIEEKMEEVFGELFDEPANGPEGIRG